ncbi:NAD(P)H-flavin oxidoreductase [Roseiconus nitratireducens]|uniref:NAD(P)H-flavin oxidoreductase n=1 Tax=Roseiconus nitratireducens TaxID=2605748 RepID=A0A5M6D7V5_9BACT|nr:nitroreductase family protein [Roseiconus nitratireducens]KAA5543611.1 NAD(P)H-flavin oxidoreductase [Roseiconus nitratireducens]
MSVNPTEQDVLDAVNRRWSPYRFERRGVEPEKLRRCFEAARWAASSFNEQPWRWILAEREDSAAFDKALGCLLEANRAWAANAGVLILTAYRTKFSRNENPNRVALHDLGQAAAHLALQAAALGLQAHQMAGVNLSQIRTEYQIPEDFEPATAIAIGYPVVDPPQNDEDKTLAAREAGPRQRRPISEQVFAGTWGNRFQW